MTLLYAGTATKPVRIDTLRSLVKRTCAEENLVTVIATDICAMCTAKGKSSFGAGDLLVKANASIIFNCRVVLVTAEFYEVTTSVD